MKIRCYPKFEFKCPEEWEKLDRTTLPPYVPEFARCESRFCHVCNKNVYKIDTLRQLDFASKNKHCVALFVGRRTYDGMNFDAFCPDEKPTLGLPINLE